jgi:H+/Cl- antiporter ClcA
MVSYNSKKETDMVLVLSMTFMGSMLGWVAGYLLNEYFNPYAHRPFKVCSIWQRALYTILILLPMYTGALTFCYMAYRANAAVQRGIDEAPSVENR